MFVKKYEAPSLEQASRPGEGRAWPQRAYSFDAGEKREMVQKSLVEVTAAFEKRIKAGTDRYL